MKQEDFQKEQEAIEAEKNRGLEEQREIEWIKAMFKIIGVLTSFGILVLVLLKDYNLF